MPSELLPRLPGEAARLDLRPGGDYGYCAQDPVNQLDPLGLSDQLVCSPADPSEPPVVKTPPAPEGTPPFTYLAGGFPWLSGYTRKELEILFKLIDSLTSGPM